jgi:Putative bacterial sensory transduction regulator
VAAVDAIESYVSGLPALRARRLAHGEWGITVPGAELDGRPLDVGLRLADGLLRAQAVALQGAGDLDPWLLLAWNRQTRLVRIGCTRSRDIWVHADVPAAGLDELGVDRLLGLIVEATLTVRALRPPADAR